MPTKKKTLDPKTRRKGDDEVERFEQLDKVVSLRLTASDHEQWLSKVKASGQTRSEFFRSCVLGNKTTVVTKTSASADKLRLIFYFNKTSNNINQLTWSTHLARKRGLLDAKTFERVLEKLNKLTEFMARGVSDVD